jgi:hypothetical protein
MQIFLSIALPTVYSFQEQGLIEKRRKKGTVCHKY